MFCRFGLVLDSRPVAARTWLKVVWIRPSAGSIRLRQRVEVGVRQLRHLAPALDPRDDLVLVADLGEDPGIGREPGLPPPLAAQAELLEQDLPELLRGPDRELAPGQLPDLRLQGLGLAGELLGDRRELGRVELDALALHPRQHLDQRHLDLAHHPFEAEVGELHALAGGQLPGQARGLGRIVGPLVSPLQRELPVVGTRIASAQGDPLVGGELVELVGAARRVDQVGGDHRVVSEVERPGGEVGQQPPR